MLLVLGPQRLGLTGAALTWACLAVTVIIAGASYRWIEAPIRAGALAGWRIRVLGAGTVAATAVCFVALGQTSQPPAAAVARTPAVAEGAGVDAPLSVLVLGDSVARALASGFPAAELDARLSVTNSARTGCGIASGTIVYEGFRRRMLKTCDDWPGAWQRAVEVSQPDVVVILLGAWEVLDRLVDDTHYRVFSDEYARYLREMLAVGVDAVSMSGASVVMLTTPCFNQEWATVNPGNRPEPKRERNEPARVVWVNELWRSFVAARPERVTLFDLQGATCPNGETSAPIDGAPLQFDGVHFSPEGAAYVWRWLAPQLLALSDRG